MREEPSMTNKLDMKKVKVALERKVAQTYEPVKPAKQFGFVHHNVDCIGCRACEIACKDKNGLPPGPRFRRVMYIEGGTYPDVFAYKVNMSCNHCAEPACLPTCPNRRDLEAGGRMASSISIRRCASAAAVARPLVPTARRSGIRKSRSSRSATCASMKSMPAASPIA
jgi:ferredoxin